MIQSAYKNAFLIYGASRYDIKGKQVLKTREKYYAKNLAIQDFINN